MQPKRPCESVPGNALVFTEPVRSRMSAIQETIEIRSGKYVGRFWSSSAFSNPQPNPQKVCLIRTSTYFGSPRVDTVELWGSSPRAPTIPFNELACKTSARKAPNGSIKDKECGA
jgi:hypothetical protein